jgi:hypothetical protein
VLPPSFPPACGSETKKSKEKENSKNQKQKKEKEPKTRKKQNRERGTIGSAIPATTVLGSQRAFPLVFPFFSSPHL